MVIGVCELEFHLPSCGDLKHKRMFVNRLKDRLRSRFNVATSETGHQDLWQRTAIAVVSVGTDRRVLERLFEKVVEESERHEAELLRYSVDYL
ncbi:MAG: DUF503 family protein [Acidobacteria bacterium]|nr:DUF503 family protein [Acidobacteriota bacterium]